MKTFNDHLIYLFKIMALGAVLAWLVSCDETTERIRIIQRHEDSIGMARANIQLISMRVDSLANAFADKYPAKVFPNTHAGEHARLAYRDSVQMAYLQHLKITATITNADDSLCKQLYSAIDRYKRIIDSLKILLQ